MKLPSTFLALAGLVLATGLSAQEPPALPPGLEDPPAREEPGLPAGLGNAQEPGLPTGLGEPQEPGLPEGLGEETAPQEAVSEEEPGFWERLPAGLHGFWDLRFGPRLRSDPAHSREATLAETRFQGEYQRAFSRGDLAVKADVVADAVTEEIDLDPRQLNLGLRAGSAVDLRFGRQILTWGTGDLVFINDLFPKDWQAFLSGRDTEYLKAPSDAVRLGWFNRVLDVDLVYTPRFDPDRYVSGERLSYWSPAAGHRVGDAVPLSVERPDDWLSDDEIALRLYRSVGSWELAFYGYDGFWKSPAGVDVLTGAATFPRLRTSGASVRGPLGRGIVNFELGYYDSLDDRRGDDPFVANGELRLLAGWEQELAHELTGGFQLYVERMLDHGAYLASLPPIPARDRDRVVLTARLTWLRVHQTLTWSWFSYWSPSDRDAYLRPSVEYDLDDRWSLGAGLNVFFGASDHTFFGQFRNDTNAWASLRFAI